jgi:hypothetical protein
MRCRPVPYTFKAPAVDDVSHQKNRFGVIVLEQAEQLFGLAAACSEMDIGDEERFYAFDGVGIGQII